MPNQITIDDLDIRAIERALGDVRFDDDHRMAALRCCESCDIQACPGSGKTTLLVAKLAILARKWRWRDRGILVLSHTNVARNEIEERLSGIGGHQLLSYPHFVGTIQKFTNQFLALPRLRSKGVTDARIDSDLFARRLEERYVTRGFVWPKALRREWRRNPKLKKILIGLRYEFINGKLRIGSREGELIADDPNPPALTTSRSDQEATSFTLTEEILRKIYDAKNHLAKEEGIFCYDDMYALAQKYINSRPWVAEALGWRFPWVFIDEMQDTDSLQENLLRVALANASIIQRIGDINQAIFNSTFAGESSGSFPAEGALQLPGSLRYCPSIATIARPLTRAQDYQELVGNSDVSSRRHTVFTFTRETIEAVLPAFGRLLQEEYSHDLPEKFQAKAVGARKTGKSKKEDNFPFRVSDYFGDFSPTATSTATTFSSCLEFALNGYARFERTGNFSSGWDVIFDGFLEIVRLQGVFAQPILTDERSRPRRHSKRSLLEKFSCAGCEGELRLLVFSLLNGSVDPADRSRWEAFSGELLTLLGRVLEIENWNEVARRFCGWVEFGAAIGKRAGKKVNTFTHRCSVPVPDIEIEVSTIHAAKGETHTATLVLDTFERCFDLKSVLPFLLGSRKQIKESDRRRMKRVFVAMTRPRELLCLAMRRDHISSAQRRKLEKSWNFIDL